MTIQILNTVIGTLKASYDSLFKLKNHSGKHVVLHYILILSICKNMLCMY